MRSPKPRLARTLSRLPPAAPARHASGRRRIHGDHHRRLGRRIAAPGDPRRQRQPRRRHDRFNITGSGVHTIAPADALPTITDAVTIDGYTQPGSPEHEPSTRPSPDRDRRRASGYRDSASDHGPRRPGPRINATAIDPASGSQRQPRIEGCSSARIRRADPRQDGAEHRHSTAAATRRESAVLTPAERNLISITQPASVARRREGHHPGQPHRHRRDGPRRPSTLRRGHVPHGEPRAH